MKKLYHPVLMLGVLALIVCASALLTGCTSAKWLSQSDGQTRLLASQKAVRVSVAAQGGILLPSPLSDVPMSGAAGYIEKTEPLKDPQTGAYIVDKAGRVQYGHIVSQGAIDNARDVAGMTRATLTIGGAEAGIIVDLTGKGIASAAQVEVARIWAGAPAALKEQCGKSAVAALEQYKGMTAVAMDGTGKVVSGVITGVLKAQGISATGGVVTQAVNLLLKDKDGKEVTGTVKVPVTDAATAAATAGTECVGDGCQLVPGTPEYEAIFGAQ